jgi:hypothetical protein
MSAKVIELFPNGAPRPAVNAERMSAAERVPSSLEKLLRMQQFLDADERNAKQYGGTGSVAAAKGGRTI